MTHRNVAQAAGAEETRVPQETIENFCKHAQGIVRVTTRSLAQELQLPGEAAVDTVREVLQDDLYQDPVQVYRLPCSYLCVVLFTGRVRSCHFCVCFLS
jgi:hypothetical protein